MHSCPETKKGQPKNTQQIHFERPIRTHNKVEADPFINVSASPSAAAPSSLACSLACASTRAKLISTLKTKTDMKPRMLRNKLVEKKEMQGRPDERERQKKEIAGKEVNRLTHMQCTAHTLFGAQASGQTLSPSTSLTSSITKTRSALLSA